MCEGVEDMKTRNEIIQSHPETFQHGHTINVEKSEKMLLDVKEILDSQGIPFWLFFGTFLGPYRDGKLLETDDDVDLAVYVEDIPRFIECDDLFTAKGFEFAPIPDSVLYRDGEHIDLCTFMMEGDKRACCDGINIPAETYRVNPLDFETPCWLSWLGKQWRILNNPEKWLEYLYGSTWRTPARKDWVTPGKPQGKPPTEEKMQEKYVYLYAVRPFTRRKQADEILAEFDEVATKLGITHFLYRGTCLGLVRDGVYTVTDPDIDFGILCDNWTEPFNSKEIREKLAQALIERGFEDPETDTGGNYCFMKYGLLLDIYYKFSLEIGEYLKKLEPFYYNNRMFFVPSPACEYFEYQYGSDWRVQIYHGLALPKYIFNRDDDEVYTLDFRGANLKMIRFDDSPELYVLVAKKGRIVKMERLVF